LYLPINQNFGRSQLQQVKRQDGNFYLGLF
jgi:hypothetical protein